MPRKKKQVISKEYLEQIKTSQINLNNYLSRVGVLEAEKHALLHSISNENATLDKLKLELEKEYGSVTIDLETGEYKLNENGTDTKD